MYGTVSRFQIKPGLREGFLEWAYDTTHGRAIPGHLRTLVFQMDADPATLMLATFFAGREDYHNNAASPEQHAEYLAMMKYLTGEPQWNDGEILFRVDSNRQPAPIIRGQTGPAIYPPSARSESPPVPMFGTIAHIRIKPGLAGLFRGWIKHSAWTTRPIAGMIEASMYELDADPYTMLMVVVFESREAYFANANSSAQHAEYVHMMEFMTVEPEWHDGDVIYMG